MRRWRAVYGETCMHGSEASAWKPTTVKGGKALGA